MRVLSRLFRRRFLQALQEAFTAQRLHFAGSLAPLTDARAFAAHLAPARQTEWVVYAKRPFAGPQQVLDYVGRYTHRVAISNERLLDITEGQVTFRYTDYRREGADRQRTMTLEATEFIRRFLLHVLPSGFHRMRYYGLLGNRHRAEKLAQCRRLLGTQDSGPHAATVAADDRTRYEILTGVSFYRCPVCQTGHMIRIDEPARACPLTVAVDSS